MFFTIILYFIRYYQIDITIIIYHLSLWKIKLLMLKQRRVSVKYIA